jgi:hypothetical protein
MHTNVWSFSLYHTAPSYKFFYCLLLLPSVFKRCYFVLSNMCQTIYTRSVHSSYNFSPMGQPSWPSSSCILSHKATISSFRHSLQAYFLIEETTILCLLSLQQVQICIRPVRDINKYCRMHLSKQQRITRNTTQSWYLAPILKVTLLTVTKPTVVYDNWHMTRKNSQLHYNSVQKHVERQSRWTATPKNTTKVLRLATLLPCTSLAIQPEVNRCV